MSALVRFSAPTVARLNRGVVAIVLLCLLAAGVGWWQLPLVAGPPNSCAVGTPLHVTLPNDAQWDLCWAEATHEGILLSEIYYTAPGGPTRKVLREAALSQIEIHYDDGQATFAYASEPGLGGAQLLTLASADCPAGTLLGNMERKLLCQTIEPRGYLYKYYTVQRQGDALSLFSVTEIGQRLYIVQWRFLDDGTIEPRVGEAGRLARRGQDPAVGWPVAPATDPAPIGISYITNYWWRLDFDLGGNGPNDYVDEFQSESSADRTQLSSRATQLNTEAGRDTDPTAKRSWRVRDGLLRNGDGHALSYHLEPQAGYRYEGAAAEPWAQHDFYATVAKACERLPVANPAPTSAAQSCGAHVAAFIDDESLAGADVVLWYRLTAHRLPRTEDRPLLSVQWHGYQLLPRDWTAQNPF